MNESAKFWMWAAIPLVLLLVLAGLYFSSGNGGNPAGPSDELVAIRDAARKLQDDGKWCDAEKKWGELARQAGAHDDMKAEAEHNGRFAKERCAGKMIGPGHEPVKIEAKNDATTATPEDLLKHYPVGRVVQSLGVMDITGRGRNVAWGFRKDSNFAYSARGTAETKVLSNNGTRIEFETSIPSINQSLVVTDQKLQLAPIESPLLALIWKSLDDNLKQVPVYRFARKLAELDPQLEKTLTWLNERVTLLPDADARYVAAIDALAGHRFGIEYSSDFGVKTIGVLEGAAIPEKDLISFAPHSGLLMDYVFGDVLKKKVGEEFSIDAKHLVRMIGFRYDVDVSGEIQLKREADEGEFAVMSIVGGEVAVEADVEGVRRVGGMTAKGGSVKYHRETLLVTVARVDWDMDVNWATEDHLLFGTKGARNIVAKSYYEAQAAPAPAAPADRSASE